MKKKDILNLIKEKKILIGSIAALMVCGIGVSIMWGITHSNKGNSSQMLQTSQDDKSSLSEEKQDEYENKLGGFEVGEDDGEVIPNSKAYEILSQARSYSQKAQWKEISDLIKPLITTYNLKTDEGVKIQAMYYDSAIVLNLKELTSDRYSTVFKGFRDAQDLLLATLQIPEEYRRDVIINPESLSPIYRGEIVVTNTQENYTGTYFDDASSMISEISSMTKIDFCIEGHNLEGYVINYNSGALGLYKIVSKEGETNYYKTVNDWVKLDAMIEQNIKTRKTVKDGQVYSENKSADNGVNTIWEDDEEKDNSSETKHSDSNETIDNTDNKDSSLQSN